MRDHAVGLETAFESSVDRNNPPGRHTIIRDIAFRVHFDVFFRALSGDLPARKKPVEAWLHSGARVVGAHAPPKRNRLP